MILVTFIFLKKKTTQNNIRIAGEDLEDLRYCWLTYRLCCFIFARSVPDFCHEGTKVKAKALDSSTG